MSEALFEVFGVTVTITGVYAVLSVLVLILFMSLWLVGRKKKTGKDIFAGQVMNGIGFGLLPALAILKAFQEMSTGDGTKVFEPIPMLRWVTENGFFRPGRIETAAAAGCFVLLCLWLILRKKELPDNGDLLMIAVCIWAAIRLVTEDFRAEPQALFHYTSCATLALCLIIWCVRRAQMIHVPVRTAVDLTATGLCIAINLVTAKGILSVGSQIGDLAVKTGSALLALILTLLVGGEVRKLIRREEGQKPIQNS